MTRRAKLSIAVDLDGIVADLAKRWLELYNAEFGHGVVLEDLKSWDMHENVKIGQEIYKYLNAPNLYVELEPMAGAVEALQLLKVDRGHSIHIISSPSKAPQTAADKLTWCKARLPFLKRQDITLSHQKDRFITDVFIDDSPSNIKKHVVTQPKAKRLGIAWPYNECVKDLMDLRAESFRDPLRAWAHMVEFIDKFAESLER